MKHLRRGKVNMIHGGSVGSEGKGKIGGYLALEDKPEWGVCAYSPNAGHVWVSDEGQSILVKQVPQCVVNPTTKLIIGPDAAINPDILKKEVEQFKLDPSRLFISSRAVVIEQSDIEWEKENLKVIASTFQGTGAAKARKVRRDPTVKLADSVEWMRPFCTDTTDLIHRRLQAGDTFIMEGHQGAGLDLNHGIQFPFCTSSMTNTSAFMAAIGVPPRDVGEVIGVIRPYPIRVGNFVDENGKVGSSGPLPDDAHEMTWAEVMAECGGPIEHYERTTVTLRVRRVFSWSDKLYRKFVDTSGPTQIALNFVQYVSWADNLKTGDYQGLSEKSRKFIEHIEEVGGVPVTMVGTGAKNGELVTRTEHMVVDTHQQSELNLKA